MVEPDAMPGNNTFVAGFTQGVCFFLSNKLTELTILLANVGDTSPNTYVTTCALRLPSKLWFLAKVPTAKAPERLGTASCVRSTTLRVVTRPRTAMAGKPDGSLTRAHVITYL